MICRTSGAYTLDPMGMEQGSFINKAHSDVMSIKKALISQSFFLVGGSRLSREDSNPSRPSRDDRHLFYDVC